MAIVWPLRPDGTEVPIHSRSWVSRIEGYPVFCASNWKCTSVDGRKVAHWRCGYCTKMTTDTLSPSDPAALVDCRRCGKTNRVNA